MDTKAAERLAGRLVVVGVRGGGPGDAGFDADVEACAAAGVGGVVLFDRDLTGRGVLGGDGDGASGAASDPDRNVRSPEQLNALTATLRDRLGGDVIIAIDQEGGRVARLTSARGFVDTPSAAEVGAMGPAFARAFGEACARQLRDGGVTLNFAPCVDVAVDASNAVIAGMRRAYSSDPDQVAVCAAAVIAGHRAAGVACCVKHFPGHGSSAGDSHVGFVDITETWQREVELLPYRRLLSGARGEGPAAVMTGHVVHRGVDGEMPASLSRAWVQGVLRGEIGWDGVVVTDSLDMGAVSERFGPGEAAARAVSAGHDLVLYGANLPGVRPAVEVAGELVEGIARAVVDGAVSADAVERSVERVGVMRVRYQP